MVERLLYLSDSEAQAAPMRIRQRAEAEGKQIKQIVWDEAGGYPEHGWGYVQWSLRPYEQRQGCDGTIDLNVHLIGIRLCQALGLDYEALYRQAYEWQDEELDTGWITDLDWEPIEAETIVPELSGRALRNLLYDLQEINNDSLVDVLQEAFTELGYDMEDWWQG